MKTTHTRTPAGEALRVAIKGVEGIKGRVGWFDSAKYPDGTSVAYVATIQEFGYASIPPRLGMRNLRTRKQNEWISEGAQVTRLMCRGELSPTGAMELLALKAAGDMRKAISTVQSPPLSEITLMLREYKLANPGAPVGGKLVGQMAARVAKGERATISGSAAKPLNETGYLLATLTHLVGV